MSAKLEAVLAEFPITTPLNAARQEISEACYAAAAYPPGIYRLNIPTGGGKTLAGLRFALAHAQQNNSQHIYYVAAYLSIIEQNASVVRKILGEDAVFEHHSNVVLEDEAELLAQQDNWMRYEYLAGTWQSPVIMTSMVQFLQTLFSDKKASIRRMHQLANAVIILDEIQVMPLNCIGLFNLAINALSKMFGATILLCSATLPPFEKMNEITQASSSQPPVTPLLLAKPPDLTKSYQDDARFKRTSVVDKQKISAYTIKELGDLCVERLTHEQSLLVILNTKDSVNHLYTEVVHRPDLSHITIMALTTSMCPRHRLDNIRVLKEGLGHEQILCISTQLIEAGVDLSFSGVVRSLAGLDQIAQAAGRCNRHRESDFGEVWIVNDGAENLDNVLEITRTQEATQAVLDDYHKNPQKYHMDLLSPVAVQAYYKKRFSSGQAQHEMRYPIGKKQDMTIVDLLTDNTIGLAAQEDRGDTKKPAFLLRQAFKEAGEQFAVIDQDAYTVLVPYGQDGEQFIADLAGEQDPIRLKKLLRKAQGFSINIYAYQYRQLKEQGAIYAIAQGCISVLHKEYYSEEKGLQDAAGEQELLML